MVANKKRRRGDSLVKKAREHIAGGEGYDAREAIFKLYDKYPDRADRETSLLLAMSFEVDGRIYKAEDWTRNILEKYPDYLEAWEFLAYLLSYNEGRIEELEEVVAKAKELGAFQIALLRSLGHGYSFNKRENDAVRIFKQVAELAPDDPHSWDSLGWHQFHAKQYNDSLESWKKKLELKPDDDRAPLWIERLENKIQTLNEGRQ